MYKIFRNQKPISIKYIIDTSLIEFEHIPTGVYKNIEKYPQYSFGCPSVSSANNTLYTIDTPIEFEIEFGLENGDEYFRYLFDNKTTQDNDFVHTWLKKIMAIQNTKGQVDFQIIMPYAIISDDKDLLIQTLPPPNVAHENCTYVSGAYRPYGWIRNLNSSWALSDKNKPARIAFKLNNPIMFFHFSKPVTLEYTEKDKKTSDYLKQSRFISTYRLNQKKLMEDIIKRRPKKLI
tara:strand:+ start:1363 stop:2064 length:702 start_codon:yes stop_codon:yes gene_type:complete